MLSRVAKENYKTFCFVSEGTPVLPVGVVHIQLTLEAESVVANGNQSEK
jgi:hypothetical protein